MNRILVPALLLFGVALSAADPTRTAPTPAAARLAAETIQLKDEQGRPVGLASHRGKVVLVDFWATWCGGCKRELPWFQEFETKYAKSGFAVIAVSMNQEGWSVVRPFLHSLKLGLQVVIDDGDTSKRYGFQEMPAAFLIDRQGRVAAKYIGVVDRDNMETNIKLLLAEK